jgi:hypothetical protein
MNDLTFNLPNLVEDFKSVVGYVFHNLDPLLFYQSKRIKYFIIFKSLYVLSKLFYIIKALTKHWKSIFM